MGTTFDFDGSSEQTESKKQVAGKVTRVLSHAKESLKLLEAVSAERTRKAGTKLAKKLGIQADFSLEAAQAEELATLRTEVAALRLRVEQLELQLSLKSSKSRREQAIASTVAAETLPRS